MSSLFLMVTITDRRSTDAFLQLYEQRGVDVNLRTVGSGTAVRETLATLGLEKTEKAVLLAVVTEDTWKAVRTDLRRKMRIDVPGTGIAFTVPLSSIGGRRALMFLTQHQPLTLKAGDRQSGPHRHHYGCRPRRRCWRWHGDPRQGYRHGRRSPVPWRGAGE